ncbi:MAG: hypothetical protein Q9165_001959 [Trypethelium subeluteriae]
MAPSSSTSGVFPVDDLLTPDGQVDMDWNVLDFVAADVLPPIPKTNEPTLANLHVDFDPQILSPSEFPWHDSTVQDDLQLLAPPESTALSERPDSRFLARLPISDPVANFTASLIMEMLLAFPEMMLRRETLPPFIHGHRYRTSDASEICLPQPLVNCMGIAQVFASKNIETRPFLWHAIKNEQRSFMEKIIYIIMRVHDNSKLEPDLNLEMLVAYQTLCEGFRNLCDEPFCQDERVYPSASWEDWIFAESRRRTGVACDVLNGFRSLPLCSPKAIWEAKTPLAWQSEYDLYKSMPRTGLDVLGDLIDACKQSDMGSSKPRLDDWNAKIDNLGILLRLSATMT